MKADVENLTRSYDVQTKCVFLIGIVMTHVDIFLVYFTSINHHIGF